MGSSDGWANWSLALRQDLPTGPYQTRVHTQGQRQTQAAGHLNLAGSGLHDSSDAGAGADLPPGFREALIKAGLPEE